MGFTVENKSNSVVKFVFEHPFTKENMIKVLEILTKLLDIGKPFAFIVDTSKAQVPPLDAAKLLRSWMETNRPRIKTTLLASCIVIGTSTYAMIVRKFLIGVFTIQPTVSPNLITPNYSEGEKFVGDIMKQHFNK